MAMQLDYVTLHDRYDPFTKIRGIVHVGACTGEEREAYACRGVKDVLWVEANPQTYDVLADNVERIPRNKSVLALLSDVDDLEVDFYVTSNYRAASSSMLKLAKHAEHYPNITVTDTLRLTTLRFDTLARQDRLRMEKYNFLNLDVQGAELKVLKGFGELLVNFDYVYSEINVEELYEGCVMLSELDSFLGEHGFVRRETGDIKFGWSDALWVRKEIVDGMG